MKIVERCVGDFDKYILSSMDTEPMVIKLKENCMPKSITVHRKVPYTTREDEFKEI